MCLRLLNLTELLRQLRHVVAFLAVLMAYLYHHVTLQPNFVLFGFPIFFTTAITQTAGSDRRHGHGSTTSRTRRPMPIRGSNIYQTISLL